MSTQSQQIKRERACAFALYLPLRNAHEEACRHPAINKITVPLPDGSEGAVFVCDYHLGLIIGELAKLRDNTGEGV